MMMRFLPGLFNEGFDDMFHDVHNMKCDIKEKDGNYLLDIELPGYKKEKYSYGFKGWIFDNSGYAFKQRGRT